MNELPTKPSIVLHHLEDSRSQRILWMLEELELDYRIERYARVDGLAPDSLRQIHPLGKSPVLGIDDQVLAESGVIVDYLASRFGDGALLPEAPADKLDYQYWLHYAEGSLMPILLLSFIFAKVKSAPVPFFVKPITRTIANKVVASYVGPNLKRHLTYVENHLEGREFFVGDRLSAADIQMSFPLETVANGDRGTAGPAIMEFVDRIQTRPAYLRALEKGGDYAYA